jgi:glycosyltransferase involved in cell wall biosynthesis
MYFPYIKQARAVIISSLWEDPGAVMIEAAFCNTTIISSNCPNGPNEFISNNQGGYLFESNKLNSLENSINIFLNDSQKQIFKKKIFAKKKSKNYTIYNHYKLLNKILND